MSLRFRMGDGVATGRRRRSPETVSEGGSIDGTCWVEVEYGTSWRACWFREIGKKLSRNSQKGRRLEHVSQVICEET